jgi:Flp pilus assembly protein TadD
MHRLKFLTVSLLSLASLISGLPVRADELSDVQRLHYAGQTAAAMQRADLYLATRPKDPQMRFLKGVMLSDSRHDAEAIAQFQSLVEDYPDLAEPYNNLAALYAAAGDFGKARVTLEQALRTNPSYATAYENLGDVHAALAAQSYARALQLEPSNMTIPPKLTIVRELYKNRAKAGHVTPSVAQSAPP